MPNEKSWRGAIILLVIAVLGTYFGEQLPPLKDVGTTLWPPLQNTLNWIVAPTLPRGLLVLGVVLTWFAAGYYFSKRARRIVEFMPPAVPAGAAPGAPRAPESLTLEEFDAIINTLPERQARAVIALFNDWPEQFNLNDMYDEAAEHMRGKQLPLLRSEVARDMEALAAAGLVHIDQDSETMWTYSLTKAARDCFLDHRERTMQQLRARADAGATPEPKESAQAPETARFAPETFKRTPSRCRALLAMLQRVDARTTLHELQQLANGGGAYDVQDIVTKAQLQHDMEDAERAGIVTIEHAGTLTQYYNLAIPEGRDWVLTNQEELRREALTGATRRDLRTPGR
jgi:hypothetical protein